MRLIVIDENHGRSELPIYWSIVEDVIRQISEPTYIIGLDDLPLNDVTDAVVVALGKKSAEAAYGAKLGNYNEEAGNEYECVDAKGNKAPLVLQYHPGYVMRMSGEKGGAAEKSVQLWYDVWDTVQTRLLGLDKEPPQTISLTDAQEIVTVLEHVAISPLVVKRSYDYETWGDRDARRPELNRTFRVLSVGLAWSQRTDAGVGKIAVSFPLDRDQSPAAQQAIAAAWLRIIDVGATAHNAQYEHKCNFIRFGRSGPLRDTMLMDNVVDELQRHKLERVMVRCKIDWAHYKRRSKPIQENPAESSLDDLLRYNALDALATLVCDDYLEEELERQGPRLSGVARGDELICSSLARLELAGMRSDLTEAGRYRVQAKAELADLEAQFRQLPEVQRVERWAVNNIKSAKKGAVFNPKSPPMMRRLLIHELKVPIKPNREGVYKLDKRGLEPYVEQHAVLKALNRVRSLSSMVSGFLDKWEQFIGPDGNIHSRYRLAEVVTGRLSSSDPPQQNMPHKSEVRRAIISRFRDGSLVEGDAVQQEPRLIAGWSQDERMLQAINDGKDLHGYVASLIFNVEYRAKETEYREEFGKRMNLGIIYGQTEWGLAAKTGITVERARELLAQYDEEFPSILKMRQFWHQQACELGYVEDLFGARRHLPAALSADDWQVKRALRQAGNFPIQSTANRFTLFSLCVLHSYVDNDGLQDMIVPCGTVHDSIIADAAPGYERRAADMLEAAMTWHNSQPYWRDRGVRMEAEIKMGHNLKDTQPLQVAA